MADAREHRLVRNFEFCNGDPDIAGRRGMGPQSQWIELGPVEWVKRNVLPLLEAEWGEFWFHSPFGVGSFGDDGRGNKIPIYEIDQASCCRDHPSPQIVRIYDEFPKAASIIKEAQPDAILHVYAGRLTAVSHLIAGGLMPGLIGMMKEVSELLWYLLDGVGVDSLGLDNSCPKEGSEEYALMELIARVPYLPDLIIEPLARVNAPHLAKFASCINADYFLEELKRPEAAPFAAHEPFKSFVHGRLAPGSPVADVARDAVKWSNLKFAYGVQHHLAPVDLSPFKLLEMGLA